MRVILIRELIYYISEARPNGYKNDGKPKTSPKAFGGHSTFHARSLTENPINGYNSINRSKGSLFVNVDGRLTVEADQAEKFCPRS